MNFLPACKNVLVSFLVTTSIYFGFVPFVLLKPAPIETKIEIAPALPTLQIAMEPLVNTEEDTELTEKQEAPKRQRSKSIERPQEAKIKTLEPRPVQSSETTALPIAKSDPNLKIQRGKVRKKSKKRNCTVANPNIQKVNDRNYILPKKLIRHYSRNWTEASRLAYLGWSKDAEGTVRGVKIRHISCSSPLPFAGLKKGDVVLAVNGKSVNSNAKLMKLVPRLFHWRTIELTVLRGGRPLKIQYRVIA